MHIHLFPRPSVDTGIGFHWCTGRSQVPLQQVRSFWIPQLRALGAAWVKLNDHRECLPLVEEFLAAGIQPIVRIYRPAPNPDPLTAEDLTAVDGLVRAGVRYLEISHRPDLPAQWRNGALPPDAQTLVARHLAQDLAEVLGRGGLPALPAVEPAAGWDLISELIRLGRRDVLQGPIWQAIHNPGHNRPPNYPADSVHTEGAPLTQNYYLALADEEWEGDAWQGRTMAEVNRLRHRAFVSQQALAGSLASRADSGGLFNFSALHTRHRELLGRSIPILSTNAGYVVGAADDPRYPALTPSLHLTYTLEACRMLMGTSTRYAPAPDYFFCASFWLLANQGLESSRPARERDTWYSPDHANGVLPIVPVLQAEAKRLRHAPQVSSPEQPMPSLRSSANISTFNAEGMSGTGVIGGNVQGGASVELRLVSLDSGLFLHTISRANGDYRFVDLPSGRYSLWVEEPVGSRRSDIVLEYDQSVAVDLAVRGWGYEINEAAGGPGGMLRCSIALTADMAAAPSLRLRWVGGERVLAMVRSGKERMARCSAGPLEAGVYDVELLGIPDSQPGNLRASVPVGRAAETHIHFVHSRMPNQGDPPRASAIEGRVASSESTQVTLYNAEGQVHRVTTDPKGGFRFTGLAAGSYSITVAGAGQVLTRTRLGVDGEHNLLIGFDLPTALEPPPPARSALQGCAPGQAGRNALLISPNGPTIVRRIDEKSNFRFDDLAPGPYDLVAGDFRAAGLQLDAGEYLIVKFPPAKAEWQVQVRSRASLRRPGLVRVQVLGRKGITVTLQSENGASQARPTGSAVDYGPFAVEFGPLESGTYTVGVEGLPINGAFALDKTDAVVITFQRDGSLSGPPRIEHAVKENQSTI